MSCFLVTVRMLNPRKEHETSYTTTSEEQGCRTTRLRRCTGDFVLLTKKREREAKVQRRERKQVERHRTAQNRTEQRLALRLGPLRPSVGGWGVGVEKK